MSPFLALSTPLATMSSLKSQSLSPDQLLDKLATNRWAPLITTLAALVLLIYAMAQWTWRLLGSSEQPRAAVPLPSTGPATQKLDVQPLLAAQLFGRLQPTASATDPRELPLSSLNLTLTGVMARGPSSFAFLSINGAPEIFLTIGQEVTSGATLEAVYPDRIILKRGASLEGVLLKDSDAVLPAGSIAAMGGDTVRPLGGGNFSVNRQALNRSLTPETLSQAAATPGPNGLTIRSVQSGSMFEKIGLKAGDVVRFMNGQPVTNLEQVMKVYAESMSGGDADDISVEITRGGKTEVLTYQTQRNP
jgi:general secretion pathway protein C